MNYLYNVRSFRRRISREMFPSFPTPYTKNRQKDREAKLPPPSWPDIIMRFLRGEMFVQTIIILSLLTTSHLS